MFNAWDMIVNEAIGHYAREVEEKEALDEQVKVALRKAKKVKPSDSMMAEGSIVAAKIKPGDVCVTVSKAGTITAQQFIENMRNAGRRVNDQGVIAFDATFYRTDQIDLIDSFVGYDHTRNFGSQLLMAELQAARETRKFQRADLPTRSEKRRINASLSGYVAGIPSAASKVAKLLAFEQKAVEDMIELECAALKAETELEQQKCQAMAMLERERIANIRRDLDAMGWNEKFTQQLFEFHAASQEVSINCGLAYFLQ